MEKETKKPQAENILQDEESEGELTEAEKKALSLDEDEPQDLVTDDMLMGIYGEILENIRKDRGDIDDMIANFAEMVINAGDSSNASKEALVNLIKIKSDTADKMIKIGDLMTRIKLKEKNTMQDWQKARQNTINIIDQGGTSKRELIEALEKNGKKAK